MNIHSYIVQVGHAYSNKSLRDITTKRNKIYKLCYFIRLRFTFKKMRKWVQISWIDVSLWSPAFGSEFVKNCWLSSQTMSFGRTSFMEWFRIPTRELLSYTENWCFHWWNNWVRLCICTRKSSWLNSTPDFI